MIALKQDEGMRYLCALIEHISRTFQIDNPTVVRTLGKANLQRIYDHAEVFHCELLEAVTDGWHSRVHFPTGNIDKVSACPYKVPSVWDIGMTYANLIASLPKPPIDSLMEVFESFLPEYLDNYRTAVFFRGDDFLRLSYAEGRILDL